VDGDRRGAGDETACTRLVCSTGVVRIGGRAVPVPALAERARRYARGFGELGFRPQAVVTLGVREVVDLLALAFGAWWNRHAVCVVREPDDRLRDAIAVDLGAVMQVCDPGDITDVERIRHRDVPAVAPAELAGPAATWPPLCRARDVALFSLPSPGRSPAHPVNHAAVLAGAALPEGPDAVIGSLVRALASADASRGPR
jgi:hypothetical protein